LLLLIVSTALAEQHLIQRLRMKDETAVATLHRRYSPHVYQLALRWVKNVEDAEEITQDVFFKAIHNIDDFRGDSALTSWLYRITFNTSMSRLRHLRSIRGAENALEPAMCHDGNTPAPEIADRAALADEAILRRELSARLMRAVWSLPAIYRSVVILRDLRGLSTKEASARLKLNGQTLKSRLHRGRLLLRRQLADFAFCRG
jgi:RNA polymerase sigma-70 factor (ECF subfamily)